MLHASLPPFTPLVVAGLVLLGGCAELAEVRLKPWSGASRLDQPTIETLADLPHPADAPLGPEVDVVVVARNASVELINRTAEPFRDVRVWLNEQYVSPRTSVEPGEKRRLDLRRFVNALEEPFPIGTLLEPDAGRPVLLAELHDAALGVRYRLPVQHNDDDLPPTLLR